MEAGKLCGDGAVERMTRWRAVHDALARWAADELRSLNAQIELVLRRALVDAGWMPKQAGPLPRRGRPRTTEQEPTEVG